MGHAGRRRAALVGPAARRPLQAGQQVLRALGALDEGGATERGRRLSELGPHPRLARALLDGAALLGAPDRPPRWSH